MPVGVQPAGRLWGTSGSCRHGHGVAPERLNVVTSLRGNTHRVRVQRFTIIQRPEARNNRSANPETKQIQACLSWGSGNWWARQTPVGP